MLRGIPLVLALAAVAHSAVIRGNVVEHASGRALARATVTIQSVSGGGSAATMRTDRFGSFTFSRVTPGAYIVRASRTGFLTMEYGQRRWNTLGVPVFASDDSAVVVSLRLPRFGAVTGFVYDENDIGLRDVDVAVYRAVQPPQFVARGRTDDRGFYRVGGLEPGNYYARSLGIRYDDGGEYVATFASQTIRPNEARYFPVNLDDDSRGADIRAISGSTFDIDVTVICPAGSGGPSITLASDLGRQVVKNNNYRFTGFSNSAPYEVLAECQSGNAPPTHASWVTGAIPGKDVTLLLTPIPIREISITVVGLPTSERVFNISYRRRDLAGAGSVQTAKISGRIMLSPGIWELMYQPPPGYYVSNYSNPPTRTPGPFDGWNTFDLSNPFRTATFQLSSPAASIEGVVRASGDPVSGAPVFLEPYDPNTRSRTSNLRVTRADTQGRYRFDNVPPGSYRLIASFEFASPDSTVLDLADPKSIQLDARTSAQQDLTLYGAR